jgi:single-strand DNA-binding protein
MLDVLIAGKLFRDPKPGRTKTDKPMCSALVRVPMGEDSVIASVIAFEDVAERLARLRAGDAVSITGSARLNVWQRDGETRPGLDVTASAILSAYDVKRRRGDGDIAPGAKRASGGATARPAPRPAPPETGDDGAPFDDSLTF